MPQGRRHTRSFSSLIVSVALLAGCAPSYESAPVADGAALEPLTLHPLDPPAGPDALAPQVVPDGDGLRLSWLEPIDGGHRLVAATLEGGADTWSPAEPIVDGDGFFANWADRPAVVRGEDGALVAHWLGKLGGDTYAYGVHLAVRGEQGEWARAGLLHDDDSPTEHGFVAWLPGEQGLRAFWLDGRGVKGHGEGAMQLRTAVVRAGRAEASVLLDDRTCDCCDLDAVTTPDGALVVYRDRSESEVRDIAVVRQQADGWSEPTLLAQDGWTIAGCPVNGPVAVAEGERVVVAWYTAADDWPRIQLAFSDDGGRAFGEALEIDGELPLGRLDMVADGAGGVVLSWLDTEQEGAMIRLRRVAADGTPGPVHDAVATTPSRGAGVPRLGRHEGDLLLVWLEASEPRRLRAGLVPIAAL